ncbi:MULTISPECIES: polyphosphate kinase 2 [Achromobacter]|jgi:polyphosphate kinase 2|uniref:polyphosphate kinase 2 n=1 Tax=Achromobacter TaxID=222 RepID=UPI0006C50EED|nr:MULTISPECIES: polyphosphate kinase 2 [Achromobacter]MCG2604863.1 polyphosphate kinase 2 [Achromobacter sp.]CUJ64155.1 polyphosphate kinase 2 [Achromobacter sp. 2789STDY5608621]CUJ78916.1 polyphosphate kinase 2 [Achromobacter sp. 2789STDY5608633]CUJ80590.1 polyphosphate kinase 2 [Achromobacter sp. 2789STDY5608628]CUK21122.1 polyphosphate kinase 2 [Achromobacter sp. 2789STDY5608615]
MTDKNPQASVSPGENKDDTSAPRAAKRTAAPRKTTRSAPAAKRTPAAARSASGAATPKSTRAARADKPAKSAQPPAATLATPAGLPAIEPAIQARKRVNAREVAARQETSAVLADIARRYQVGESGEAHAALRSVIEELSPDDAVAVHRALLEANVQAPAVRRNPDEELATDWREGIYPYRHRMLRRNYEKQKYALQVELLKLQAWVKATGQRVVILFEGRDAAGKGGTIKRMMEHLNPRGARVVALEKPSDTERGQWYFQRYVQHLPTAGEIVMFDRSWYNRAGVERVMGFCSQEEYLQFLRQVPDFERHLVTSGIHLVKFWFSVSQEEQRRRFLQRKVHPLKQWKLSPVDLASLDKWDDYTRAKEAMFAHTDTADAPWIVVKSDCKKRARLNAMRYVLSRLPYEGKSGAPELALDPLIVGRAL